MKLSGGKRVLMFFHWLFSLLICAGLVALVVWPDVVHQYYERLAGRFSARILLIAGIAALGIYLILCIAQLALIFRRRRKGDRGFIEVDSSENGRVRLAISAIEQMVRQSVTNIDGLNDMKIGIKNQDDAIEIGVRASIMSGCHVPTITMNMQHAIRQFVEVNCGVAVREVSITIKSITETAEKKLFGRHKNKGVPGEESAPAVKPAVVNTVSRVEPDLDRDREEPYTQPAALRAPWERQPEEAAAEPASEPAQPAALRAPWERQTAQPVSEPAATDAQPATPEEAQPQPEEQQPEFVAPADDPIARYFADARASVQEDNEAPEDDPEEEER